MVAVTTNPDFPGLSHSLHCQQAVRQSSLAWLQRAEALLFILTERVTPKADSQESLTACQTNGLSSLGKGVTLDSDRDSPFVILFLFPPPQPLIFLLMVK